MYAPLSIKDYGAVGNGIVDDTVAIQAAIDAAAPGHLAGPVNAIAPVIIPYGDYKITRGLNATNIHNLTIRGENVMGSMIDWQWANSGGSRNAILDLTGSVDGLVLENFQIRGTTQDSQTPHPNNGILLAASAASANAGNFNSIKNVSVTGRFYQAAIYVYGVCCSSMKDTGVSNFIPVGPGYAPFGLALTANNALAVTSDFTQIASGYHGVSDWTFVRSEFHNFTSGGGTSGPALLLEGGQQYLFMGGQYAAANDYIIEVRGNVSRLIASVASFYSDQGQTPKWIFGGSGTLYGVMMQVCDVHVTTNVSNVPTTNMPQW